MLRDSKLKEESAITIVSYIPNVGAIVQISVDAIPHTFQQNQAFKAIIEIHCGAHFSSYNMFFEFKETQTSATNKIIPPMAIGLILGMDNGLQNINSFSVKNVITDKSKKDFWKMVDLSPLN